MFGLKKELECYESDYDPHKDVDESFAVTVEPSTYTVDNMPSRIRHQRSIYKEYSDSDSSGQDGKPTKKYYQSIYIFII